MRQQMQQLKQVPALNALHNKLREGHKLVADTPSCQWCVVRLEKNGVTDVGKDLHWVDAMIVLNAELGGTTEVSAADGRDSLLDAIEVIHDTSKRTSRPFRVWHEGGEGGEVIFERMAWTHDEHGLTRFKWVGTGRDIWEALQNALTAEPEPIPYTY